MSSPARGLVGHPGSNHLAYQLVAALQRRGFDVGFETGVFWTGTGLVPKLAALLPEASRAKLERELKRRSHAGVDPASVTQRPLAELLYVATTRLKLAPETQLAAIAWRNDLFDAQFAARVCDERPAFVIGHDSSALAAQRAVQRCGGLGILNQVIGHIETGLALFAQEARLAPEFAETLPLPPSRVIAQCRTEALEADRVIVPSTYVADTMVANGTDPSRIFVLPYGVDTARFRPAPTPREEDGKFRVLFVGGLTQRKGIKYLLEAAKRAAIPDLELVCVGKKLGSDAAFAPYADFFRHVPHVPFHEVHRLYQSADAFAYPSLHEGSAFASYEALASGLPVVCTPNTGSVVQDGVEGFLVPIRDVDALVERLRLLARDPDLRARMGIAARARAEQFTWAHYGDRLSTWLAAQLE